MREGGLLMYCRASAALLTRWHMLEDSRSKRCISSHHRGIREAKGRRYAQEAGAQRQALGISSHLIRDGMYVDGHDAIEVHVVSSHWLIGLRGQLTRHGE